MGRCFPHLSFQERIKIAKWREARMPIPEIVDRLGRAPSTIYRELNRNFFTDKELPELNGYYAMNAQGMYEKRRAIHRKMIVHPELKEAIEDRLKAGWSPEQIAGRMRLERHPIRVSHAQPGRVSRHAISREEDDLSVCLFQGWPRRTVLPASARTSSSSQATRVSTPSAWPHL